VAEQYQAEREIFYRHGSKNALIDIFPCFSVCFRGKYSFHHLAEPGSGNLEMAKATRIRAVFALYTTDRRLRGAFPQPPVQ
jgi:hypothetical protein